MPNDNHWIAKAACAHSEEGQMLHNLAIENENQYGYQAARFCVQNCPVMAECLSEFKDLPFGVVGGKGALERIGPASYRGTSMPPIKRSNRAPLNPTSKDMRLMAELYKEGQSMAEIGRHFDTTGDTIRSHLKKNGVKIRTKSEAQQLRVKRKGAGRVRPA